MIYKGLSPTFSPSNVGFVCISMQICTSRIGEDVMKNTVCTASCETVSEVALTLTLPRAFGTEESRKSSEFGKQKVFCIFWSYFARWETDQRVRYFWYFSVLSDLFSEPEIFASRNFFSCNIIELQLFNFKNFSLIIG